MAKRPTQRRSSDESGTVDPEHTVKIDEATEKAAAAVRKAAEEAASDRAHARARTSTMATFGLLFGVVGVLAVLTGALAALGIILGALALFAAVAGFTASGRHYSYLAGRSLALIGLLLGVVAIVVGILATTGALPALGTDTNQVEWLHDLLPSWLS